MFNNDSVKIVVQRGATLRGHGDGKESFALLGESFVFPPRNSEFLHKKRNICSQLEFFY